MRFSLPADTSTGRSSAVHPIDQAFIDKLNDLRVSPDVINTVQMGQTISVGLLDILYLGVKLGIYPCLIFMGVGAGTDFGPLIANPKTLLLGAAAQLGIFMTYAGCRLSGMIPGFDGFTSAEAGSIGIIGGADGPTAIFVTSRLAPHLLGPIAVAAYSYMALVPVIQPPHHAGADQRGGAEDRDAPPAPGLQA